jgi:hypothetical protein
MVDVAQTPEGGIRFDTVLERYHRSIGSAFDSLDLYFEGQETSASRHNLVWEVVRKHVTRMRGSFRCWEAACYFADAFKIDTTESGFPIFRHVLELEDDLAQAKARMEDLPAPEIIREEMLELLLKYKQFPTSLQRSMAQRIYFETLNNGEVFRNFQPVETIRRSFNPKTGNPYYVVHWAHYDGVANLPLIYMATLEDSSEYARKNFKQHKSGPWGKEESYDKRIGLPNSEFSAEFQKFAQNNSAYSRNLTSIATAMDQDFPHLHPKQLRRVVLGPFYVTGVTSHGKLVKEILSNVTEIGNAWLLSWTVQELFSKGQSKNSKGLWGGSQSKEIYHIDNQNLEAVQQGVSEFQNNLLVHHDAYQAVYAGGAIADFFKDYQCHIVSGDKLLSYV